MLSGKMLENSCLNILLQLTIGFSMPSLFPFWQLLLNVFCKQSFIVLKMIISMNGNRIIRFQYLTEWQTELDKMHMFPVQVIFNDSCEIKLMLLSDLPFHNLFMIITCWTSLELVKTEHLFLIFGGMKSSAVFWTKCTFNVFAANS